MYVAFIVDCYSHRIVAWHAATSKSVDLVMTPLRMALWERDHTGHPVTPGQLISHSEGLSHPRVGQGVCNRNGVNGGFHGCSFLQLCWGGHAVGEGDREGVECRFPACDPSCLSGALGVQ